MPRLIGCLIGIVLVGTGSALLGETHSYSSSCGGEAAMTFDNWRKWTKVTPKPVISKAHNNNWVGVYVDDVAKATYLAGSSPYPECARIVKPVYTDAAGSSVLRLTVMVKMPPGYDPENGDWWYGKYDASGTRAKRQGKLMDCIGCHRQAADTDYLFSKEVIQDTKE